MSVLFQLPKMLALNVFLEKLPGAKLYFYAAGTSTPQNTYTTDALAIAHTNPVIADANGRFPPIFLNPALPDYKVNLTDSTDTALPGYPVDNYPAGPDPVTAGSVGQLLYPTTTAETALTVVPTSFAFPAGNPYRYGAVGDGVEDDTLAVQTAINVQSHDYENGSTVHIPAGDFLVDTLTIDARGLRITGDGKQTILRASANIPDNGAILLSLASDADEVVNQALLDGIYGAGQQVVRQNIIGSLEDVVIRGIQFVSNAETIRGIWMTGFTRGCSIQNCVFKNFVDYGIALNGSWSFSIIGNRIVGPGTTGIGIGLGISGSGTNNGAAVANVPLVINNWCGAHSAGMVWNFGAGGAVVGNTFEGNSGDGFRSQSADGVTFAGNYMEDNNSDNLRLGGTNDTDFCVGWTVSGNHFTSTTTDVANIRLQAVTGGTFGPNNFGGDRTQRYFLTSSGGHRVTKATIYVPAVSSTYITNSSELDFDLNIVVSTDAMEFITPSLRVTGNVAFYGATPIAQQTAVTNPTGGSVIDVEGRTATIAIIDRLQALNLIP